MSPVVTRNIHSPWTQVLSTLKHKYKTVKKTEASHIAALRIWYISCDIRERKGLPPLPRPDVPAGIEGKVVLEMTAGTDMIHAVDANVSRGRYRSRCGKEGPLFTGAHGLSEGSFLMDAGLRPFCKSCYRG